MACQVEATKDVNYVQVSPKISPPPVCHHDDHYEPVGPGTSSLSSDSAYEKCGRLQDTKLEDAIVGGEGEEPHVTVVQDYEPIPRLYHTLPRKATLLQRLRKKPGKTIAEVAIQVGSCAETPEQRLQEFMEGVSSQMLQLQELCAKQERLETLGLKIMELIDLNKDVVSSTNSTDKLIVAYMEARDELDQMKSKLDETFNENDVLMKRLDEQEEDIREMMFQRDEVKKELETSMSKAKDIELNSSFLVEENDDVKDKLQRQKDVLKTMYEQLENALHKRDKYKKLFVKLKVNSSLNIDHYINELNLALHENRQVLMKGIAGGPNSLKVVGRQIDNFLNIQQECNRFRDQAEYLSAQLAVDDLLIDEIKEQMEYLTQVLNEYRKAGIKPPTPNAQLLLKQIDRYTMLMKDKDQYFSEMRTSLKDKMDKLNGGTKNSAVSSPNPKSIKQEKKQEKTEEVKQNKTNPIRMVTSHGDTPMINTESGKIDTRKSPANKKHHKLHRTEKVENFSEYENKLETTQSMPNVVSKQRQTKQIKDSTHDDRWYNYF